MYAVALIAPDSGRIDRKPLLVAAVYDKCDVFWCDVAVGIADFADEVVHLRESV